MKKKSDTLPKLLKKTEKIFNQYIRHRDQGLPCISCGKNQGDQAGHYFPVRGHSSLRFDEFNVNLQCAFCNCYLHGNQAHYRQGLVEKIGEKAVKELEERSRTVYKWTRSELEIIIQKYTL